MMKIKKKGSILYVGQCYYNAWYISRALRKKGWKADVLNIDPNEASQIYYHGEDFRFLYRNDGDRIDHLVFFLNALVEYDIFHFSNAHAMHFLWEFDSQEPVVSNHLTKRFLEFLILFLLGTVGGWRASSCYRILTVIPAPMLYYFLMLFRRYLPYRWDVKLIRKLGKKIVYTNNSCQDGVSQTSFRKWSPEPVCDSCIWKDRPDVCSDEKNLRWGSFRNKMADYQITMGGNRVDCNDDPRVHEVPEFYCLDHESWKPNLMIPSNYLLALPAETTKVFHAVGNFDSRTEVASQKNIKSTHIYVPLMEKLKQEGYPVELIFFKDVPNRNLRFYMAQADIVVDMLTYGWFGAIVREAMMLGKPCICFLRPEWLESMRAEVPDYVAELPVVHATPHTIEAVLKDLIENPEKRKEIGRRSREFAVKWHSAEAGADRMDAVYSSLLDGNHG